MRGAKYRDMVKDWPLQLAGVPHVQGKFANKFRNLSTSDRKKFKLKVAAILHPDKYNNFPNEFLKKVAGA